MLLDLEIGMERGVNEIGMGGGFRFGGIKRLRIDVDTMFVCGRGLCNIYICVPIKMGNVHFLLNSAQIICLKTWLVQIDDKELLPITYFFSHGYSSYSSVLPRKFSIQYLNIQIQLLCYT